MKRIEVTSCGGCPFNIDDDGFTYRCKAADGRISERFNEYVAGSPPPDRPDWCPLDAGPVVVMSPTADGNVRGDPAMTNRGRLHRTCESCPSVRACYGAKRCEGAPGTEVDLAAPDTVPK